MLDQEIWTSPVWSNWSLEIYETKKNNDHSLQADFMMYYKIDPHVHSQSRELFFLIGIHAPKPSRKASLVSFPHPWSSLKNWRSRLRWNSAFSPVLLLISAGQDSSSEGPSIQSVLDFCFSSQMSVDIIYTNNSPWQDQKLGRCQLAESAKVLRRVENGRQKQDVSPYHWLSFLEGNCC